MIVLEVLRVALGAIRVNALRSVLTSLGVIIGVGAVITMIALGEGARASVREQIEAMGTNLLFVRPGIERIHGVAQGEEPLTPDDAAALLEGTSAIAAAVPQMTQSFLVEYRDANTRTTVTGTSPDYPAVENFRVGIGRFFNQGELEGRRRVAVLGSEVVTQLGVAAEELIGSSIRIGGIRFEVIGVLASKGQASWFNPDDQILVPLSTAQFRLMGTDRLRSITVQVTRAEEIPRAITEIERVLRRQHRIRDGQENDFTIRDQTDLRATFESATRTFSFLLAGIAAVSLLVGGIGIMNIMLVSVTERTREIGLRKALGATSRQILLQFLAEALVLCLLGGVLGILAGGAAAELMARLAGWTTIVKAEAVLLAFSFAAAVGLFFGLYPAARASRLEPIEALRYE